MNVLCFVCFRPLCWLTKYTVVGTALSPTLIVCMMAVGPGDPQALFSPSHQCRSTEVRSRDCSSHSLGPTVGAMEAAQILAQPSSCVYMPTKPTAAKVRPVLAGGALVLLDVLQVLNLGSCQWGCDSTVHATVRRDFSSSFLVNQPLGLSCGFSPYSRWIS